MTEAFFTTEDDRWFTPTDHTRGPWDEHACHAGPPTGLMARAMENSLPGQRLTRITVDLLRPIPFAGFQVKATVTRKGKTVSTSHAQISDAQGKVIISAAGMHMTEQPPHDFPTHKQHFGTADQASPGAFPIRQTLHDKPAFNGTGVQTRYPQAHDANPGPTTAWLKTVPLLVNESPSAFQRICPLADCGNAFGRNAEPDSVTFLNTDLTVLLHRDPQGDWLGSHSVGYWESNGHGMADAMLFDEHGVVGRALQTLLLRGCDDKGAAQNQ